MNQVELGKYKNTEYSPGSIAKRTIWYLVNALVFNTALPFSSKAKCQVLRLFGAKVGKGVVLKPRVTIKYPWFLTLGDFTWVGEGVWIDNLSKVSIGSNVCLSQGVYILTGSHNYKLTSFDLIVSDVHIESGVWIGTKAIVCPGVTCHSHSVLTAGSVATTDLEIFSIYQGNPAVFKRDRVIRKGAGNQEAHEDN